MIGHLARTLAARRARAALALSRALRHGDTADIIAAHELLALVRIAQCLARGTPADLVDPHDGWDLTLHVDNRGHFAP